MVIRKLLPPTLSDDCSNGEASSFGSGKIEKAPVATRWSEADFEKRLGMLLAMDEGVRTLALKLYDRFQGQCSELPVVVQILQEKWGFPDRLFPLLNTHLRRAVCRCRGTYVQLGSKIDIPERDLPDYVESEEWVQAFWKWLEAVHARCGKVKLTRRSLVRQHTGVTGIDVLEEYIQGPQLGEGSFGTVSVVFHKALGVNRAVKVIDKALMSVSHECAEDEVHILKSLDHPHILRIYEALDIDDKLHIIMDYAEGGDLARVLRNVHDQGEKLTEDWSRVVALQIASALEYIHSKGVIHCDLKPANAMLLKPVELCTEEPHIVLVDFGISEIFEERYMGARKQIRGTLPYLSPDAFNGEYTDKSDMWALGVIIFEMLLGKKPFIAANPVWLSVHVATREPPLHELPLLVQEVIRGLLAKDAITRLSAKECKALEWFSVGCAQLPTTVQKRVKAVQSLGHVNYFHQSAMFCVASGLSMKDMNEVFLAFQAIDTDKSGRLTQEQFAAGLQMMGIEGDPEALMAILDVDRNGYISYTEFLAGTLSARGDIAESLVREAFSVFDVDGNGIISMHELRLMLSGDGPLIEVLPDGQTVDEIMEEVGSGKDGISVEDFISYMQTLQTTAREPVGPLSPALLASVPHSKPGVQARKPLSELTLSPSSRARSESVANEMITEVEDTPPAAAGPSRGLGVHNVSPRKRSWPPLHRWLSDVCGEDPEVDAINRFLNFPEEPLDSSFVAHHIGIIRKHLSAGISLAHMLVQGKGKDDKTLRKAVSSAAEVWGRVGPVSLQHNSSNPSSPLEREETGMARSLVKDASKESDLSTLPRIQLSANRHHHEQATPQKVSRRARGSPARGGMPVGIGRQPPVTPQLLVGRGVKLAAPRPAKGGARLKPLPKPGVGMIGHHGNLDSRSELPPVSRHPMAIPTAGIGHQVPNLESRSELPPLPRHPMATPTAGSLQKKLHKLAMMQGDWRPQAACDIIPLT